MKSETLSCSGFLPFTRLPRGSLKKMSTIGISMPQIASSFVFSPSFINILTSSSISEE